MYDLRHSSATLSIAAGTDIKTVSTRLGHSDIRTTLNIYTHTLDEMDKKASDNLEDMLFKSNVSCQFDCQLSAYCQS